MKNLRRAKKGVLTLISIIMGVMIILPAWSTVNATTRDENIKKIETFLSTDAATEKLTGKGETYERVMRNVGTMSDRQVEKLAEHANVQMVQVGGEIKDSSEDFWTFYKWYLIASLAFVLILVLAA